jgi:shikimate dehydrogenase
MTQLNIDGKTAMFASIGQHLGFSPVTGLFNTICSLIGYNAVMLPFATNTNELTVTVDALRQLKCKGILIDTPYRCDFEKSLAMMTKEASHCEAVNVVKLDIHGLHGHNTEINAFEKSFPIITGEELSNKNIFLIGSGGIARAIAVACASQGCNSLSIANRTLDKARQLSNLINIHHKGIAYATDFNDPETIHRFYNADIIIHATSSGMYPNLYLNPLPENYQFMAHHLVLDTVYHPPQTKLMQTAQEKGCRFFNTRDVMFFSCIKAFQWLTNVRINTEDEKKLFHIWKEMLYNV